MGKVGLRRLFRLVSITVVLLTLLVARPCVVRGRLISRDNTKIIDKSMELREGTLIRSRQGHCPLRKVLRRDEAVAAEGTLASGPSRKGAGH